MYRARQRRGEVCALGVGLQQVLQVAVVDGVLHLRQPLGRVAARACRPRPVHVLVADEPETLLPGRIVVNYSLIITKCYPIFKLS